MLAAFSSGPNGILDDAVHFQFDAGLMAFDIYDDTFIEMELVQSSCTGDKRSNWQVQVSK